LLCPGQLWTAGGWALSRCDPDAAAAAAAIDCRMTRRLEAELGLAWSQVGRLARLGLAPVTCQSKWGGRGSTQPPILLGLELLFNNYFCRTDIHMVMRVCN